MNISITRGVILALLLLGSAQFNHLPADEFATAAALPRSPSPDGAEVDFRNIQDGDQLPLTFVVEFRISGMGIAPAGTQIENTGHHHLLIDQQSPPPFDRPLPATDHLRHFGKGQSETELTLPAGEYTLQLLFADYLHIPHQPPVISDKIIILVSADAPSQESHEENTMDES